MCKNVLITGVTVTQQMKQAKAILKNQVIPKEKTFQERKQNGSLSNKIVYSINS